MTRYPAKRGIFLCHRAMIWLYRTVFCRGGYGVHSPFAFDLITNVIEEKRPFYCYEMLDNMRLQLRRESRCLRCGDRELTAKQALRRLCFSAQGYRLLFRLANRFHPGKILAVGSGMGLTPLSVTACSTDAGCVVFEPEPSVAVIARNLIKKYARSSIGVHVGMPGEPEPPDLNRFDFIVWGTSGAERGAGFAADFSPEAFEKLLRYAADESVMIISGINGSRAAKKTWKGICAHPGVSVTMDLYSLGIVFFSPKLNRKTYKCIPL
ncbi:MAG: hypothetical protein LBJ47_08010 [Tannerella sp.]|jgi:hypothetical protein|nr:hypothetical protein [Tannerella sp.]